MKGGDLLYRLGFDASKYVLSGPAKGWNAEHAVADAGLPDGWVFVSKGN